MNLKSDISKFTLRKEQKETLDFISDEYNKDKSKKIFLLDLPTGVGKSVLALNIADWYSNNVNRAARIDIITSNKILQDQYCDTFGSINDLRGRDNYECEQYNTSCTQGAEFNKLNKTVCENCPYSTSRDSFISGKVSLTNFHLFVLYSLYFPKVLETRGASVLIVDECLHPDTKITLYDETTKNIKDIEIGDLVKTVNEKTGLIENKPVVKLHHNLNKGEQMYEIEMNNSDIIRITGNHKVKLINGCWKKVEDLIEEDEILYIKEKIESHEFDNNRERYNI